MHFQCSPRSHKKALAHIGFPGLKRFRDIQHKPDQTYYIIVAMNSILTAAFLVTAAFGTPILHPTHEPTNVTINTRSALTGEGESSGITINMYPDKSCKGNGGLLNQEFNYNTEYAQQTLSYWLSDDIGEDQVLSVWADTSYEITGDKPVDPSLNGNTNAACAQFVYNLEAKQTKSGCHTLPNVVGCMIIMST